jgi:L-alanine-DL-glutamate epimerase-like enolase superfamily enzyme
VILTTLFLLQHTGPDAAPLLLSLATDSGATAYAALPEDVAPAEAAEALADLEPLVLGHEPLERGALWERLALAAEWREAPEPAVAAALSALDLTLWQLAAEQAGLPLYALLGGRVFPRSDTYERFRPEHLQALSAPPGGVRLEAGDPAEAVAHAEDLRRRWGDEGRLFLNLSGAMRGLTPALELAQRLQAAEVFWCVDLLRLSASAEYRELSPQVEVPFGAGATATGLRPFRRLLEEKAVDLLAVDLRRCGGITGAVRIAWLAALEGLPVAVLAGAWPINQLLAVHLAATSGTYLPVARPEEGSLAAAEFTVADGFLTLPATPGLGARPLPETLADYAPLPEA